VPLAFSYANRFFMVLLYGRAARLTAKNGGFRPGQWEYSPAYALRSYLFLLPHSAAVSALHAATGSKVAAFYGASAADRSTDRGGVLESP
jgi:hypothetical protein